ncbi:MAG: HAMP domain-containing histidine kinase [Elusimicrobia bacterium]|nr:HAMP domain-containing histidine kinase [Elusimicrobiota bacterium]
MAKNDLQLFRQSVRVRSGKQAEAVIAYSKTAVEAEVQHSLQGAARRIVSVSVVTLGVGILAALLVAGQMIRPLQKIARGTQQIAAGRLSYRLHLGRGDELGRLADDFDRMAERLGELDRMKEDFVSNVTHELRSPLSAIQSYVNLMTEDVRSGRHGNTMDHLTVIRNNALRLSKFVNDILDLAKIEARSGGLKLKPVSVFEIISEVETLFRLKAQENTISLTVASPDPTLTAHADEGAVHQIITNLVSNALKFTPAGGQVTLSATSTVSAANDPLLAQCLNNADPVEKKRFFMRLSVSDTGRGIDRENLARIFDRFEQVKEAKDSVKGVKGSGLGLAISRGLAEAQGGRLLAESVLGQGSVFSLYLPKVQ